MTGDINNFKFWLYSITIIIGVLILLYNIVVYFITRVPIIITPKKFIKNLLANLGSMKIDSDSVIYEMGSGWGDFSFAIEKYKPKRITGFELSPIHTWYGNLKSKIIGSKSIFLREDFFKADISDADIVYVFLVPKIVKKLWNKIKTECNSGTVMILFGSAMEGEEFIKKIPAQPNNPKTRYFYIYKV